MSAVSRDESACVCSQDYSSVIALLVSVPLRSDFDSPFVRNFLSSLRSLTPHPLCIFSSPPLASTSLYPSVQFLISAFFVSIVLLLPFTLAMTRAILATLWTREKQKE